MGEQKAISLEVSQAIVKEIVEAQISAEVIKALDSKEDLIRNLVSQVLALKVNSQGRVDNYSSYNEYTYMEYLVGNAIRNVAKKAVEEYIINSQDKIKVVLEKEMKKATTPLVQAFMGTVIDAAKSDYRFDVKIEPQKKERD